MRLEAYLMPPPYDQLPNEAMPEKGLGRRLAFGTALVFRIPGRDAWHTLQQRLPEFRRCQPGAPFAVLMDGLDIGDAAWLGARAAPAGIRAFLTRPIHPANVRSQLTAPTLLPEHQLLWLRQMGVIRGELCYEAARQLIDHAPRCSTLQGTTQRIGQNPDRLQDMFRRTGAGITPGHFCSLVRWTYRALQLQVSSRTVKAIANDDLQYQNAHSLSRGLRRAFGVSASVVRRAAGFEPLFARYFALHRDLYTGPDQDRPENA